MPIRLEINHITKPDRQDHHSRIDWAGNTYGLIGGGFRDTPANIARCILAGTHEFYVRRGSGLLGLGEVAVRAMPPLYAGGELYIQTEPDYTTKDNLLSLPEFPFGFYAMPLPVPQPGMMGGLGMVQALRGYGQP